MTDPTELSAQRSTPEVHPRALAPRNLVLTIILSIFGAIVGVQVLASVGITPSTSIIGALVAMTLARIPLVVFRGFRSVHAQNLAQTSISSATFGAANSLFLPIGIPFLFGLPNMVVPMLIGVSCAMLLDAWLLYRMFDTRPFPARNAWPLGIAAAETIIAGDQGGKRAAILGGGIVTGALGAIFSLPMSAFGVALIANVSAMIAFAVGLLILQYCEVLTGWDLTADYVPHGLMIGAGIVALIQVGRIIFKSHKDSKAKPDAQQESAAPELTAASRGTNRHADDLRLGKALRLGAGGYLLITIALTLGTGIVTQMSVPMLIGFVFYATLAAFVHEFIVGIAAMHSGWFPAFAIALITLVIGIVIGFPPEALVVLAGFTAATGPAFADMGYDLKAGHMLRGEGKDPRFELDGRRQQMIAGMIGFAVAIVVVLFSYQMYFNEGLTAPINAAYVAAIHAGVSSETAVQLLIWAIPGAILQMVGGSKRQLGIMLATGLLISTPWAGWLVAAGVAIRLIIKRIYGDKAKQSVEVFAGGVIAGDALYSFGKGIFKAL